MGIFPCIIEAAVALHAPVELWPYGKNFAYDPAVQEWSFREDYLDRPEAWTDLKEWMERMCGWLQYKYPAGPQAMERKPQKKR
jgi:hypothetical protein